MSDEFAQPGGGGFFTPRDHDGHLVLVTEVHETFQRYDDLSKSDKLFVRLDYVDLDMPPFELVESALDNHIGIAQRLQPFEGKQRPVLGRIGQVTTKNGQTAWVLGPYTEGVDDARAQDWVRRNGPNGGVPAAIQTPQATQPPMAAAAPAPIVREIGGTTTAPGTTMTLTAEQLEAMRQLGINV